MNLAAIDERRFPHAQLSYHRVRRIADDRTKRTIDLRLEAVSGLESSRAPVKLSYAAGGLRMYKADLPWWLIPTAFIADLDATANRRVVTHQIWH